MDPSLTTPSATPHTDSAPGPVTREPAAPAVDLSVDLSVDLAGLKLSNPMMTASGTCGYAFEYEGILDFSQLGAWVTKSVTAEARPGNETYRIVETRAGMLNAIGLANVGLRAFVRDKLPLLERMRAMGPRIIVNVAGHSVADYVATAGEVSQHPTVDAVELNVSCPNVADGLVFGTSPTALKPLVREVRTAMRRDCPLIVKLSPNAGDVPATARAAIEGGCQALSLINTYTAMAIDIRRRKPRLANGTGGLSGPAIRPLAVYHVSRVYRDIARDARVPLIGMGGIQYWQDAVEFLLAGASALAIGTALFVDPATPVKVRDGLRDFLASEGCSRLSDIVGSLKL